MISDAASLKLRGLDFDIVFWVGALHLLRPGDQETVTEQASCSLPMLQLIHSQRNLDECMNHEIPCWQSPGEVCHCIIGAPELVSNLRAFVARSLFSRGFTHLDQLCRHGVS